MMIVFDAPLIRGVLLRRYKRFFADIELAGGETVVAHVANSGSLRGLMTPGAAAYISPAANPDRKLKFSLEAVETGGVLVGVNTSWPNLIAERAVRAGAIPELCGYANLRREVKYDESSRIDLLLEDPARPPAYVEVKSVTLSRTSGLAEFPDAVTTRGAKHLQALARVVQSGGRAVMLYIVQRNDCREFDIAGDIDPDYMRKFRAAREAGVEILCYACEITPYGIDFCADALVCLP